ncbi:MAG: hypothetical protein IPJ97_19265 [Proteobacteria bacterium]|nr:hypothetical protein [Pseudomonadota bacterium]
MTALPVRSGRKQYPSGMDAAPQYVPTEVRAVAAQLERPDAEQFSWRIWVSAVGPEIGCVEVPRLDANDQSPVPSAGSTGGMALAILAVAILGGRQTYSPAPELVETARPAPPVITHLVHLHAFLFTAWVVLLFIQTRGSWLLPDASTCTFDLASSLSDLRSDGRGRCVLVALHAVLRGVAPFGMDPGIEA